MGTTAALYVAANRPVSGIMLQSPPPLQDEIMEDWGWWNLWMVASITALEVPGELNSLSNAPKVKVPGVFIITGKDTIVPPEFQFKVFNAYAGDKLDVFRPDDNHNDAISPADGERVQRALDWLWKSEFSQNRATSVQHNWR